MKKLCLLILSCFLISFVYADIDETSTFSISDDSTEVFNPYNLRFTPDGGVVDDGDGTATVNLDDALSSTFKFLDNNNIPTADWTGWNTGLFTSGTLSSGTLGIGTSTPDTIVHITKDNATTVIRTERNQASITSSDILARWEVETQDTTDPGISASIEALSYGSSGETGWRFLTGVPSDLVEALQITSDGAVGIGTPFPDSPSALLHLKATTAAEQKFTNSNTSPTNETVIGRIEFETRDTDSAGTAVVIQAIVEGSSGEVGLAFETGTGGSPAEAMRIDFNGNVGIGTTDPTVTLDVIGDIRLSDWDATETIEETFTDIVNQGIFDSGGVIDTGGLDIAWEGIEVYTGSDILEITDGGLTCTDSTENWLIWRTGTTLQLITSHPLDEDIVLAHISCEAGDIWELDNEFLSSNRIRDIQHGLEEFFPVAISPSAGGLAVTNDPDGTSALDVVLSVGEYYHDLHAEHIVPQILSRNTPMVRWFQDGTGTWTNTISSLIDTAQRNSGTGLVNIPNNQYVLSAFKTSETQIHWIYSSTDYPNSAQALAAVMAGVFPANPPGLGLFPWTSFLIYKQGDTDLTSNATFGILLQDRPLSVSGALPSNDHATLTNLAWSVAAHTMDTDLDMLTNDILNAGTGVFVTLAVGHSNPQVALDVVGDITATGTLSVSTINAGSTGQLEVTSTSATMTQIMLTNPNITPTFTMNIATGGSAFSAIGGAFNFNNIGDGGLAFNNIGIGTLSFLNTGGNVGFSASVGDIVLNTFGQGKVQMTTPLLEVVGDITATGTGTFDTLHVIDKVGIGTTVPSVTLDVVGEVLIDGDTDIIQLKIQAHSTQNANILEIEDSGSTDLVTVDPGGNVFGQGFQVPNGGFVGFAGGPEWLFDDTNDDVSILSNVGIGTTDPSVALDVVGDVLVTGTGTFSTLQIIDTNSRIEEDGSSNMTFTDSVTGTKTLAELAAGGGGGSSAYISITVTAKSAEQADEFNAFDEDNYSLFSSSDNVTPLDITFTSADGVFDLGSAGVYKIEFNPILEVSVLSTIHMIIKLDSNVIYDYFVNVNSAVDPIHQNVEMIISATAGQDLEFFIDNTSGGNTVTIERGSILNIMRIAD